MRFILWMKPKNTVKKTLTKQLQPRNLLNKIEAIRSAFAQLDADYLVKEKIIRKEEAL